MSQSAQRNVLIALAVGLMVCVGCAIFLLLQPDSDSNVVELNPTVSDVAVGDEDLLDSKSPSLQLQNDSSTIQQSLVESLNDNSDTVTSKHALLVIVNQAGADELAEMFIERLDSPMDLGSINGNYWIQSIVLTKLVHLDFNRARSLLIQLSGRSAEIFLYSVMREWNRVHVNEAIKLLASLDDSLQEQGFQGLVDGGKFLSRSNLLEIGTSIGLEQKVVSDLLDRQQTDEVQSTWQELEQAFENIDFNDASNLLQLPQTAANYILSTGLDSIPMVLNLFDKLLQSSLSETDRLALKAHRSMVVSYVSIEAPDEVFEFLVPIAKETDLDLLSAAAQVWFALDPSALWDRLNAADLRGDKVKITKDIIRHWSWREPNVVLTALHTIPPEYHDQAYLDIAQGMWYDTPFRALKLLPLITDWSTPQHLEVFGKSSMMAFTIEQIISAAAEAAPLETIEWITSAESHLHDSMRTKYLDEIFQSWSQSDPENAFEMALKMPVGEDEIGLEATVLQTLAYDDLDRAIALLPRVRAGDTKAFAYERVSGKMEAQDRIAEAIQLGDDLPELDREKFHQSIASRIGFRTPFDRLVSGIQQLPTLDMKSNAASTAIHTKGLPMTNDLTDSQINELKQFLNDDDRRRVDIILELDKDDSTD